MKLEIPQSEFIIVSAAMNKSEGYRARKDLAECYAGFRALVKWPHPLSWLGPKLGLAEDDPRLPDLALRLAQVGKLVVYIGKDGSISEVGKVKKRRASK